MNFFKKVLFSKGFKYVFAIIVFMITYLNIYEGFLDDYKKKQEKFLEKGDKPRYTFQIVEYKNNKYNLINLEYDEVYQNLEKYLKENTNKYLFLSTDLYTENENGFIKKYSIVEKTKEYQLIEIYSESSDWDITSKYKVFYDGKVILTYSFDDYYKGKMGAYISVVLVSAFSAFSAIVLLFLLIRIINFITNRSEGKKTNEINN